MKMQKKFIVCNANDDSIIIKLRNGYLKFLKNYRF